ncbi:hypothetical protein BBJ29_002634 [Phytophthora kernoviae]|uniref:Uncharacterized protein n=1 Tax=Phytophthora kernoviae TaxID=325452 RepID=A0A3F2RNX5_9STRA|nr:hypothetical protein BBJ29_002634 [Phytophthora kernoviae]RLN61388.1 hypothetical protein BBP00_00005417 [Phytophthora kernoviae]
MHGSFRVEYPSGVSLLSVQTNEFKVSNVQYARLKVLTDLELEATSILSLTAKYTNIAGGPLTVQTNDFIVTSSASNPVLVVSHTTGEIQSTGTLTLKKDDASIAHTGVTSLTVTTPKLVVDTANVDFPSRTVPVVFSGAIGFSGAVAFSGDSVTLSNAKLNIGNSSGSPTASAAACTFGDLRDGLFVQV